MEKKKVFMIMPFKEEYLVVFRELKERFSDSFEFSNADEEGNQQNILKDIIQPIYEADVIVADLTELNPNVMYELGVAHSFNKKTIIITQDDVSELPFDLKQYRARRYSTHFKRFEDAIEHVRTNLNGAINGSIAFGNPITDFLDLNDLKGVEENGKKSKVGEKTKIELDDEEHQKGFIDYIEELNGDISAFTDEINDLGHEIKELGIGVDKNVNEMIAMNEKASTNLTSFAKNHIKRIAVHVDRFGSKLKKHNQVFNELWDRIEANSIGLINNPFVNSSNNRELLREYLDALNGLKSEAAHSSESIESIRAELKKVGGIEQTLTRAVKYTDEDLKLFIQFIDGLCASIDRIQYKASAVIG